ncbi:hypothetical protein J40TS1_12870 [Paenibacillus montaniterrae]|uniref:Uncharacterized protein n=1 Tax=Paenibacillus montaniterrae TaxID=429341 RepID=A0A919YLF7_9BACL|nr:hypothetical protein [Paenibacillus montaniterrae]GIP15645.1 hypothetical protein J40TS1_12870 [Paenibacillus montaniterrae]
MTAKKRNSQHQQEVGQSGSTSSQSGLMGFSYAYLYFTFPGANDPIPLAPQESFGDYITWSLEMNLDGTTLYESFSLKAGYFYSIFYRAFVQSNDQMYEPTLGIANNEGIFISDSLIAAPAVANKPVLLRNNIIIFSENSNDNYYLYSLSSATVTSEGLNAGEIEMYPASITITVIGEA